VNNIYEEKWNKSYSRGENYLIYPNEEVIRFSASRLARFVPGGGIEYREPLKKGDRILDLGCGAGRHLKLLSDLGFRAHGVDISDKALSLAAARFRTEIGLEWEDSVQLSHLLGSELPFPDNYFSGGISCSVLDSMHFDVAKRVMTELFRVLKKGSLCFIDLISAYDSRLPSDFDGELIVDSLHELGTVQSYFGLEKIKELVRDKFIIENSYKITNQNLTNDFTHSRIYVELKK
jgi:ubiquinone/menaquinone biosynthesis C-methylase UbiE